MAFSIVTVEPRIVRIAIEGRFDPATACVLRLELSALLQLRPYRVDIDLSGLRLIDAAGVELLLSFLTKVQAQGAVFTLNGLRDQPFDLFRLTLLEAMLADPSPTN